VENGQKTGLIKQFQSQQWMWFNIAAIISGLVGGWLSQTLPPASALHAAALVIACAPAAVVLATTFLVHEEKSQLDLAALRATTRELMSSLKSRPQWIVACYLAYCYFHTIFELSITVLYL